MSHSRPDCRNYIAEDLCASSSHRPAVHCHDDEGRECKNYSPAPAESTSGERRYVVSLDMED